MVVKLWGRVGGPAGPSAGSCSATGRGAFGPLPQDMTGPDAGVATQARLSLDCPAGRRFLCARRHAPKAHHELPGGRSVLLSNTFMPNVVSVGDDEDCKRAAQAVARHWPRPISSWNRCSTTFPVFVLWCRQDIETSVIFLPTGLSSGSRAFPATTFSASLATIFSRPRPTAAGIVRHTGRRSTRSRWPVPNEIVASAVRRSVFWPVPRPRDLA